MKILLVVMLFLSFSYSEQLPQDKKDLDPCISQDPECDQKGIGNSCTYPWLNGQRGVGKCEPTYEGSAECECVPE
jgi:hypothetical protein